MLSHTADLGVGGCGGVALHADPPLPEEKAMRFLPTRYHACLDYALGAVLVLLPLVAGLGRSSLIGVGPMVLGGTLILYSLFTNYEFGMLWFIPIKLHLALDAVGGVLLVILALIGDPSPSMFAVLVVLGVLEVGTSLVTRTVTSDGPGVAEANILGPAPRGGFSMPEAAGPRTADGRPNYPVDPQNLRTPEQLRGAIDSGKTGDKIAMTDPAAAPLGSDDEAAEGHDEEGLATARRQSMR
jgi:hypothetical protein